MMPNAIKTTIFLVLTSVTISLVVVKSYAESALHPLAALPLSEHCYLIQVAGNNVLLADLDTELIIVDGGHVDHSNQLIEFIRGEFQQKAVSALFNTHWHPEQTGLNNILEKRSVPIVAHKNTKQWLDSSHLNVWTDEQITAFPKRALPTQTFYQRDQLKLTYQTIKTGYLSQAHTDSDIYVYFAEDNVLAIGGVISSDRWPEIDWWSAGWFGGLLDGLETILDLANDETVIVPAHGPAMSKTQLQKEYDMYVVLFDRILALLKQSKSPAEAVVANPMAGLHPEWDNADAFVESAFRSFYGHLRGEKRMGLMP